MACRRLLSCQLLNTFSTARPTVFANPTWSRLKVTSSLLKANRFCSSVPKLKKDTVKVTFVLRDGEKTMVNAKVGDNLLDVILENNVDIDGFGACDGTLACSTCHLIFKQEDYDKLKDKPTDEEMDMLDLAYGLTDTSRLGCQIIVNKDMEGIVIALPKGVADARRS